MLSLRITRPLPLGRIALEPREPRIGREDSSSFGDFGEGLLFLGDLGRSDGFPRVAACLPLEPRSERWAVSGFDLLTCFDFYIFYFFVFKFD